LGSNPKVPPPALCIARLPDAIRLYGSPAVCVCSRDLNANAASKAALRVVRVDEARAGPASKLSAPRGPRADPPAPPLTPARPPPDALRLQARPVRAPRGGDAAAGPHREAAGRGTNLPVRISAAPLCLGKSAPGPTPSWPDLAMRRASGSRA